MAIAINEDWVRERVQLKQNNLGITFFIIRYFSSFYINSSQKVCHQDCNIRWSATTNTLSSILNKMNMKANFDLFLL